MVEMEGARRAIEAQTVWSPIVRAEAFVHPLQLIHELVSDLKLHGDPQLAGLHRRCAAATQS